MGKWSPGHSRVVSQSLLREYKWGAKIFAEIVKRRSSCVFYRLKMSKSKPKEKAGGDGSSAGGSETVTADVDFDRRVKALVEEILQGQSTRSPPSISGEPSGGAVAGMWLFGLGWLMQAIECPW